MWIIEKLKQLWNKIKNFFKRVINGVLNLARDIVGWFEKRRLKQGKHIPIVGNAHTGVIKQMIKTAPVKNAGIFQATYDTEEDEITNAELIEADSLDNNTRELLGSEEIVVLS